MPSPDLPGYVDLTLLDRGPAELLERARANMLASLPGYIWRAHSPAAALLEGVALIESERVYAVNRVPGAIYETHLGLLGIAYDQGAAPTTTVTVTVADVAGYVIPAGTRMRLSLAGDTAITFTLDANLVIAPGATFATGAATASENTSAANGTAPATALQVIDNVAAIDSAVLATSPVGGRGPETVADWFARGAARLQRGTDVLSQPSQFKAAAVDLEPAVVRVEVYDRYDPGQAGVPGDHPGHVTLAVGDVNGAPLTGPQKTALEAALEELARVEIDVHLINPTITAVEVDVTVERLADYTAAEVMVNVRAALNVYLDPAVWPWGAKVYWYELVQAISEVEGVNRVVLLATPAADVNLAGIAPLADFLDTGASVITVVDPA